ncbi:MAG: AraC family transcriptional regulator, partial [Planctomycetota bacterium]
LRSPFDISPHHHKGELQFDVIEGCTGRVYQSGRWLRFSGDITLVAYPGETHGYHLRPVEIAPRGSRVHNFKITCRPTWQVVEQRTLPAVTRPDADRNRLSGLAADAVFHLGDPLLPSARSLLAVLGLLEAWPQRAAPTDLVAERPGPAADADVEAAVTLIEERLEDPPSAAEIAKAIGVSPRHLSRLFVRSTGMTPHRYATIRRLDRARLLLLRREIPISAVAEDLGFGSHATFTRWFRQHVGETPQAYRVNPSVF